MIECVEEITNMLKCEIDYISKDDGQRDVKKRFRQVMKVKDRIEKRVENLGADNEIEPDFIIIGLCLALLSMLESIETKNTQDLSKLINLLFNVKEIRISSN